MSKTCHRRTAGASSPLRSSALLTNLRRGLSRQRERRVGGRQLAARRVLGQPGRDADHRSALRRHQVDFDADARAGSNFSTLFSIAAIPGKAGSRRRAGRFVRAHGIIEASDGAPGISQKTPHLDSAARHPLLGDGGQRAGDLWAAGIEQKRDSTFENLVEHFDGTNWHVARHPRPRHIRQPALRDHRSRTERHLRRRPAQRPRL